MALGYGKAGNESKSINQINTPLMSFIKGNIDCIWFSCNQTNLSAISVLWFIIIIVISIYMAFYREEKEVPAPTSLQSKNCQRKTTEGRKGVSGSRKMVGKSKTNFAFFPHYCVEWPTPGEKIFFSFPHVTTAAQTWLLNHVKTPVIPECLSLISMKDNRIFQPFGETRFMQSNLFY